MKRRIEILAVVVLIANFVGCGPSDGLVDVTGTVKLDGQPVENGAITFVPIDGKSPTAGDTITGGIFKARVAPGKMKVQISASKVVGKRKAYDTPDSPEVNIVEDAIPAKYNSASELISEIAPGKKLEFDLKSKP